MFYLFYQNNSGAKYIVDNKVCKAIVIEADSSNDATDIAETIGCYWDGVSKGIDCPCCGDRWECVPEEIDIDKEHGDEIVVQVPLFKYNSVEQATDNWNKRYRRYDVIEEPHYVVSTTPLLSPRIEGKIRITNIEDYLQYLVDAHFIIHTSPDARIYYKDGKVKEIFKEQ